MAKNTSGLVAVKRVDRNGKLVTRHVKPVDASPAAGRVIPAPRAPKVKPTTLTRSLAISRVAGHNKPQVGLDQYFAHVTKEELDVLDEALAFWEQPATTPEDEREQTVITAILYSLARGSQRENRIVHEMLVLRKAFCSKWSQENKASTSNSAMRSFFYGLRSGKNLPLGEEWIGGLTAVIRFAYEMVNRDPEADYLPVNEAEVGIGGGYSNKTQAWQYRDEKIANFIYANPEKTGELIELAVKHETTDPELLRYLLENDGGPKSVSSGWL